MGKGGRGGGGGEGEEREEEKERRSPCSDKDGIPEFSLLSHSQPLSHHQGPHAHVRDKGQLMVVTENIYQWYRGGASSCLCSHDFYMYLVLRYNLL